MYKREEQYIVKEDRVMIVDEFTGRLQPDRRYSDGLHQALEAKEGITIQRESQTLAQITLQHYFQLYKGLCGMTGTAKTEEDEFKQIYGLPVLVVPPNRPLRREAKPDKIFRTRKAKFEAVADEVARLHAEGRPVLIGTTSIDVSELVSHLLKARKLPHTVLNAKYHEKEAEIVAEAGQRGAITVATNMAGRGTDIKLGEGVAELGGLHVLGCQRHESRRIDNQLLGRAGRQGDPGSSQFCLSLEDDLLRVFGGDAIGSVMDRVGMKEGEAIEHALLSGAIRRAQKRVEGRNFEIRKRLLDYDLVLARQRDAVYALRDRFLLPSRDGGSLPEGAEADLDAVPARPVRGVRRAPRRRARRAGSHGRRPRPRRTGSRALGLPVHRRRSVRRPVGPRSPGARRRAPRSSPRRAESTVSGGPFPLLARYLILTSLDEAWRTHLYTLDDLKGGIGWTAYGGTDPLVAFKRESFVLFQEMLGADGGEDRAHLAQPAAHRDDGGRARAAPGACPSAPVHAARGEPRAERHVDRTRPWPSHRGPQPETPGARRPVKVVAQPGRNDPCPCGSGKKYKKCCGAER